MSSQTEDVIAEMTQRLVREFAPEQVILFGSHAWGEPHPDSDVDLFVVVKDSQESRYSAASGHVAPCDPLIRLRISW